jgi:hypothetical protein
MSVNTSYRFTGTFRLTSRHSTDTKESLPINEDNLYISGFTGRRPGYVQDVGNFAKRVQVELPDNIDIELRPSRGQVRQATIQSISALNLQQIPILL